MDGSLGLPDLEEELPDRDENRTVWWDPDDWDDYDFTPRVG